MATGDKRINFYLKKFLSVDQVDSNWFQYLLARVVDLFVRLFPQSGIWEPWPIPLTGGTVNDTFTVASGSDTFMQDDAANLLELAAAVGVDVSFENANAVDYYVGAKHIEIPDEPETNPRYNSPQWKLVRDAVGELDDPDSVSDQGGGVFRFVVNSVTESGVDHSGRVCRIYLKAPVDLGNNYEEATIVYGGGDNYVDLSTGGDLGDISTDETLYSAVVEGYTWKRNTDLSSVAAYVFLGVITGNGPAAIPTVFNISGQYRLDSSILSLAALIAAFQFAHNYSPGSGDHATDGDFTVDIDRDNDETDRRFVVTHDTGAADLFEVHEDGQAKIFVDPDSDDSLVRRSWSLGINPVWHYGVVLARSTSISITTGLGGIVIIDDDYYDLDYGGGSISITGALYNPGSSFGLDPGDPWLADTWYYIYVTNDWGGLPHQPGFVHSITPPNTSWHHPAHSPNWRCIGAVKTRSDFTLQDFYQEADGDTIIATGWDDASGLNDVWATNAPKAWTPLSASPWINNPDFYIPSIATHARVVPYDPLGNVSDWRIRPSGVAFLNTYQGILMSRNPGQNDAMGQYMIPVGVNRDMDLITIGGLNSNITISISGYKINFNRFNPSW